MTGGMSLAHWTRTPRAMTSQCRASRLPLPGAEGGEASQVARAGADDTNVGGRIAPGPAAPAAAEQDVDPLHPDLADRGEDAGRPAGTAGQGGHVAVDRAGEPVRHVDHVHLHRDDA